MPRKPSKPKTTRRGKNEGSVYRRKDGKWVGQVTVGYHTDTGKPIRKYTYASTREEAAHWIALTLVSETSKAVPSLASELLLKDFLHRWLTTFKTYEVCSRTMELVLFLRTVTYRSCVGRYPRSSADSLPHPDVPLLPASGKAAFPPHHFIGTQYPDPVVRLRRGDVSGTDQSCP